MQRIKKNFKTSRGMQHPQLVRAFPHKVFGIGTPAAACSLAFSPTGRHIAVLHATQFERCTVTMWELRHDDKARCYVSDAPEPAPMCSTTLHGDFSAMQYTPAGDALWLSSLSHQLRPLAQHVLLSAATFRVIARLPSHFLAMCCSPSYQQRFYLIAALERGNIITFFKQSESDAQHRSIYRTAEAAEVSDTQIHKGSAFSPDCRFFAFCGGRNVQVIDFGPDAAAAAAAADDVSDAIVQKVAVRVIALRGIVHSLNAVAFSVCDAADVLLVGGEDRSLRRIVLDCPDADANSIELLTLSKSTVTGSIMNIHSLANNYLLLDTSGNECLKLVKINTSRSSSGHVVGFPADIVSQCKGWHVDDCVTNGSVCICAAYQLVTQLVVIKIMNS